MKLSKFIVLITVIMLTTNYIKTAAFPVTQRSQISEKDKATADIIKFGARCGGHLLVSYLIYSS